MNNANNTAGTIEVNPAHPFEAAGLGTAPFTLVGFKPLGDGRQVIGAVGGVAVETKTGGTCDFCGMAIGNVFRVRGADGREFNVGCDCVGKLNGKQDRRLVAEVAAIVKDRVKAAREAKDAAKLAELAGIMNDAAAEAALIALPHPRGFVGQSYATYVGWMYAHAGKSGKIKLLAEIKRALGR